MTHTCKTVLNKIVKFSNNSCVLLCIYKNGSIKKYGKSLDSELLSLEKYEGELKSIIKALIADGYLEEPYNNSFQLTNKGLHHKEYTFEKIKSFIFRSIVTPIVVSAATSVLTIYIAMWLR